MTFWATCLGMLAVTFGSRYAGLALHRDLPPFWQRFLHFVPIAVFAALVTPYVAGASGEGGIRLLAVVGAGAIAWRTGNLGAAIAFGMIAFWVLRAL
ncbi:MAG: AzlD domain-containing protein [Gaiella sp.]